MSTDLMPDSDERMWTEKEVAHLLHVSVHTVWALRRDRRITFFRFPNGQIRYRRRDIENFLDASLRLSAKVEGAVSAEGGGNNEQS
jgi:hypothetical protein